MIQVGGGSPAQPLHYDGGYCLMEYHGICEHKISTIWACSDGDFTEELGATRVVLGSHLWPRERVARPEESVAAVMKKGDTAAKVVDDSAFASMTLAAKSDEDEFALANGGGGGRTRRLHSRRARRRACGGVVQNIRRQT